MMPFYMIFFAFLLSQNCACGKEVDLLNDTIVYEKWMKMDKMLKDFTSSAVRQLLPSVIKLSSKVNISSDCMKQSFRLFYGLRKLEPWAITFIDASGKLIDGILSSTTASFGDYNQCLDAVAKEGKQSEERILFRGQYCIVNFKPPLPAVKERYFKYGIEGLKNYTKSASGLTRMLASKAHYFYVASLELGLCVPSGCTSEDLTQLLHAVSDQVNLNADVYNCVVEEKMTFDTGAIVAISIYSILGFMVLTGTFLEFFYRNEKLRPKSTAHQILFAFSFQKNLKDLLKIDDSKTISCINGIRFLTITWILTGHTFYISLKHPQLHHHFDEALESTKRFGMQFVLSQLSVDTFFLVGGLVNCYVAVLKKNNNKQKPSSRSFLYSFKHRLWRILPAYAAILLSFQLMSSLVSGPAVPSPFAEHQIKACKRNWWWNLLFINNYLQLEESCMPQAWYLAAEFQLNIVASVTIGILLRYPKFGLTLNAFVVLMSVVFSAVWTELHGIQPVLLPLNFSPQHFDRLWAWYSQTMVHAGPYFIGVLVGFLLAEKKELTISKLVQFFGWILSALMGTWLIFATWNWNNGVEPTKAEDILYAAFSKSCFALAVAWTIVCCSKGYGGYVNRILSWKLWVPLNRIILCLYLISPLVHMISLLNSKTLRDSSTKEWVWKLFGDFIVSAFLAVVFYTMVENPFSSIEKIFDSNKMEKLANNEAGSATQTEEDPYKLETITTNGHGVINTGYINSGLQ